jgi:hypothetical protein
MVDGRSNTNEVSVLLLLSCGRLEAPPSVGTGAPVINMFLKTSTSNPALGLCSGVSLSVSPDSFHRPKAASWVAKVRVKGLYGAGLMTGAVLPLVLPVACSSPLCDAAGVTDGVGDRAREVGSAADGVLPPLPGL